MRGVPDGRDSGRAHAGEALQGPEPTQQSKYSDTGSEPTVNIYLYVSQELRSVTPSVSGEAFGRRLLQRSDVHFKV